jgi:hypothetical protein
VLGKEHWGGMETLSYRSRRCDGIACVCLLLLSAVGAWISNFSHHGAHFPMYLMLLPRAVAVFLRVHAVHLLSSSGSYWYAVQWMSPSHSEIESDQAGLLCSSSACGQHWHFSQTSWRRSDYVVWQVALLWHMQASLPITYVGVFAVALATHSHKSRVCWAHCALVHFQKFFE